MVEVPSLLFQLDELLERVDFLSVGSNDLMQFLYAADRGNRGSPTASIRCRRRCCARSSRSPTRARQHNKPVTLCGEIGVAGRSARWRCSASATARCRCRRPRSARSRRCCSTLDAGKAEELERAHHQPDGSASMREKLADLCDGRGAAHQSSIGSLSPEADIPFRHIRYRNTVPRFRKPSSTRCSPATPSWRPSCARQLAPETFVEAVARARRAHAGGRRDQGLSARSSGRDRRPRRDDRRSRPRDARHRAPAEKPALEAKREALAQEIRARAAARRTRWTSAT